MDKEKNANGRKKKQMTLSDENKSRGWSEGALAVGNCLKTSLNQGLLTPNKTNIKGVGESMRSWNYGIPVPIGSLPTGLLPAGLLPAGRYLLVCYLLGRYLLGCSLSSLHFVGAAALVEVFS